MSAESFPHITTFVTLLSCLQYKLSLVLVLHLSSFLDINNSLFAPFITLSVFLLGPSSKTALVFSSYLSSSVWGVNHLLLFIIYELSFLANGVGFFIFLSVWFIASASFSSIMTS